MKVQMLRFAAFAAVYFITTAIAVPAQYPSITGAEPADDYIAVPTESTVEPFPSISSVALEEPAAPLVEDGTTAPTEADLVITTEADVTIKFEDSTEATEVSPVQEVVDQVTTEETASTAAESTAASADAESVAELDEGPVVTISSQASLDLAAMPEKSSPLSEEDAPAAAPVESVVAVPEEPPVAVPEEPAVAVPVEPVSIVTVTSAVRNRYPIPLAYRKTVPTIYKPSPYYARPEGAAGSVPAQPVSTAIVTSAAENRYPVPLVYRTATPTIHKPSTYYARQSYRFGYEVRDNHKNDYAHEESSDGVAVTGSYRVLLPDGRTQIVTYRADHNGYVADIKYEHVAAPEYHAPIYYAPAKSYRSTRRSYCLEFTC